MPITKGYKANFDTLIRAAKHSDLALVECQDKTTRQPVYVACAMQREPDGEISMIPIARMFDGNPYDELNPPNPDGGFFEPDEATAPTLKR